MTYIRHRVNRISDLKSLDVSWGAEIDLRSNVQEPGKIHLSHDPWVLGDDLESWLEVFSKKGLQGPLVLNTKEDGLEGKAIELLDRFKISNFFFLDTAIPTLIHWTQKMHRKCFAVRVSTYESIAIVNQIQGAEWIWVDCFNGSPLDANQLSPLKKTHKLCLVSPELQGASEDQIAKFSELYKVADAVCTKSPQIWDQL